MPSLLEVLAAGAMPELKTLGMSGNVGLGDEGVVALADALTKGPLDMLQELSLKEVGLGNIGVAALTRALDGAPALKKLTVGNVEGINADTMEALKAAGAAAGCAVDTAVDRWDLKRSVSSQFSGRISRMGMG